MLITAMANNQFVIDNNNEFIFQSYNTIIVRFDKKTNKMVINQKFNSSQTTMRYFLIFINVFLHHEISHEKEVEDFMKNYSKYIKIVSNIEVEVPILNYFNT